jgi:uncharacterized membrane protein
MIQVSVQPSNGSQLASPGESFLQKQFNNIPFYFASLGVLGIFLFLLGFILILISINKKIDKNNKDQKTKRNEDRKIAGIITYTGIILFSISLFASYFLPIK